MNNRLLEAICSRRSIRKYTDEPISQDKLDTIVSAGMLAPRGRNANSVELILVRDPATLKALSRCREHGPGMLAGANAAIVVFGNPEATDVWTEDCSIAMTMMHLMADYLGVGSCWVQGRLRTAPDGGTTEDYIRKLLGVPDTYRLEATLSLGMPAEHPEAKSPEDIDPSHIHINNF